MQMVRQSFQRTGHCEVSEIQELLHAIRKRPAGTGRSVTVLRHWVKNCYAVAPSSACPGFALTLTLVSPIFWVCAMHLSKTA